MCASDRAYSHILREASASLLVPTIPGIPEPRSVGTGSKYGSHAFLYLSVNHFSSNGNDCRRAQPAASTPMRRNYFNWKVLIAMLISFLALAQVAWADTDRPTMYYEWRCGNSGDSFDGWQMPTKQNDGTYISPELDLSKAKNPHLFFSVNSDQSNDWKNTLVYYSIDGTNYTYLDKEGKSWHSLSLPKNTKKLKFMHKTYAKNIKYLIGVAIGDWRDATYHDIAMAFLPKYDSQEYNLNGWERHEIDSRTIEAVSPELNLSGTVKPAITIIEDGSTGYANQIDRYPNEDGLSKLWFSYDGVNFIEQSHKSDLSTPTILPKNVKRVKFRISTWNNVFITDIDHISSTPFLWYENPKIFRGTLSYSGSYLSSKNDRVLELSMDFPEEYCGTIMSMYSSSSAENHWFYPADLHLCKVDGEWIDISTAQTKRGVVPFPASATKMYVLSYPSYVNEIALAPTSGISINGHLANISYQGKATEGKTTSYTLCSKNLFYDYDNDGSIEQGAAGRWVKTSSKGVTIVKDYSRGCTGDITQFADIDGDGWIDAIDKNGFFYFGDQYGNFSYVRDIDKKALSVVDVSNDGRLQLLDISGKDVPTRAISFAEGRNPVYHHVDIMSANVYRLTGKPMSGGLPSLADGMFVGGGSSAVKFAEFINADLTGDGIPDIYSPDDGKVYAGTGDGSFIELHMPGNMKLRDLDGDGVTDIVTYDEATKTLTVHFVSADGTVTSKSLLKGLYCSTNIWLYDFDKDGDVDILVPFDIAGNNYNNGGAYLVMFENRGKQTFKKHENYIEGDLYFIDCVDIDADGNYEVLGYVKRTGTYAYKVNGMKITTTPVTINAEKDITMFADLTNSGIIHALDGSNYTPLSDKANQRPTMPAKAPTVSYDPSLQLLQVGWERGSDAESATLDLTYEVRVSSDPGKNDIVVADALADGTRRNLLDGREGYGTTRTFNVSSWPAGTYYIDVQAIDPNRRGSAFSQAVVWKKTATPADFNIEYVKPFAVGDTCRVVATSSPTNGNSYQWEIDGATVISDNADHSEMQLLYKTPGEKILRLNVMDINGNVISSYSQAITAKRAALKPHVLEGSEESYGHNLGLYGEKFVADFDADGENEMFAYAKFRKESGKDVWDPVKKIYNTNIPSCDDWTFMADVNRDGLPDLISNTRDSRYKFLITNLGDMDMDVNTDRPDVDIYGWQCIFDVDNDGNPEVVTSIGEILKHDSDFVPNIEAAKHTFNGNKLVYVGDINGDGLRDVITEISDWTGNDWKYSYQLYYNIGDNTFEKSDEEIFKVASSDNYRISVWNGVKAISDFDNDGKLDAAVYKYDSAQRLEHHAILWSDGALTPTVKVTPESGQGSRYGKVSVADFDNNGCDDMLIGGTGEHYIVHMLPGRKFEIESRDIVDNESEPTRMISSLMFTNNSGEPIALDTNYKTAKLFADNAMPDTPTGVVANETERGVVIDWNHAVDKETPGIKMRYNISVRHKGVEGEGAYLISPMNGEVDWAPVPQASDWRCNNILWSGNRFLIPRNAIANGEYVVRIQAIDAMMATSAFSAPVEFTVKGGGFGTVPSAVKVGSEAKIVTAEHVGGNIDWDGGKVIAHDGHNYTVTWSKDGVKTISDGTYTAQINVMQPVRADFGMIPDEVKLGDVDKAMCHNAYEGDWEVSFDGKTFQSVASTHEFFDIDFADPEPHNYEYNEFLTYFHFNRLGDVHVRHTVHAPYGDETFTWKYTVLPAEEETIEMVDIDPATGRLRLTLKPSEQSNMVGWYIYRETSEADRYELVGNVKRHRDGNVFVDLASEPNARSSRYRVSYEWPYGESVLGKPHRSLHVMINRATGNAINLMWTPYEGREVVSYRILRGATVASMTPIATVSGNARSFTDLEPDVAQPLYSIEMVCASATRADGGSVRSNVVSTEDAYYTTMVNTVEIVSADNRTDIGGDNSSTLQLNAVVTPITANYRTVNWTVEAGSDIATVSPSGAVEMKSGAPSGPVVVRATAVDGSGAYGEITLNAMSAIGDTKADVKAGGVLTCSPWAADTDVTIEGMADGESTRLIIFDLSGVVCKSLDVSGSSVTLNVGNLVPGHYFVRAEGAGGIANGRFVKK